MSERCARVCVDVPQVWCGVVWCVWCGVVWCAQYKRLPVPFPLRFDERAKAAKMSAADTLSERLATMVVIHPGPTTLRMGIADAQPVAIPHCVAYLGAPQARVTTPFTSMLGGGDSSERRQAAFNRLRERLGVQQRPIIQASRHCSNHIPYTGWGLQAAGDASSGG